MTTVLLVRHARTSANAAGVLAGWTPGVHLDEVGRQQAKDLTQRLTALRVDGYVTSPLERCRETAEMLASGEGDGVRLNSDIDLAECRYGEWTNRPLSELRKEPLWRVIEQAPSSVTFPSGEALAAVQARALSALRRWNARYGPDGVYVAVSHGDVIKAVVADALGMHLDMFQRLTIEPCSVTVVKYGAARPQVLRVNDVGGTLREFRPSTLGDSGPLGGGDVL